MVFMVHTWCFIELVLKGNKGLSKVGHQLTVNRGLIFCVQEYPVFFNNILLTICLTYQDILSAFLIVIASV